jgi:hypothetical protein
MSPDSLEGQFILKDRFVTKSIPEIRRKLQKLAVGPESMKNNFLKITISVLYNWDQEEALSRQKSYKRKATVLITTLQMDNFKRVLGVGLQQLVKVVANRNTSKRAASVGSHPNFVQSVKETTGGLPVTRAKSL